MKRLKFVLLFLLLSGSTMAQEMVRIVRWVSPVTGDFETLREDFNPDVQLQGWGYKNKLYQFSAYKTRPNDPNTTAVNRWVMPNCAASILIAEHEIPEATLLSWGYKSKQFLFYAYRTKPASGDFVAVNRWINAKPQGDKCRDFTLTVAETELTDAQLISYGYSGKVTQFWVPRPGIMRIQDPIKVDPNRFFSNQLLNPDFEIGNLTNWTIVGNGFQVKQGDLPIATTAWEPRTMPLGGDYWQGLTPNFTWNNGRQGNWFASSSQATTGSLLSTEFVPQKKFINFLIGGNAVNQTDKNNLRVELLALNDGTFPTTYQKSVLQERIPLDPRIPGSRSTPVYRRVSTPFQQVTVEGKSYFLVEDLTVKGDVIQAADLFIRKSIDLSATEPSSSISGVAVRASLIGHQVRLRVVDESGNGYIYFDDVKIEDTEGSLVTAKVPRTPLWGFVDMHTHLMSHLGFGKKLLHGAPDIGIKMPAGTTGCNPDDLTATTIDQALGNCNSTHGGWGTDNGCGNYLRAAILNHAIDTKYEYKTGFRPGDPVNLHGDHEHQGYPRMIAWPHWSSITHQQMWWEWLKRAHEGGLRVMVVLAVNNKLLAKLISGDGPYDDKESADIQLDEIDRFVARHNGSPGSVDNFMDVATSASHLRQIVGTGRLAIIKGIELDNIGNFIQNSNVDINVVRTELRRLYTEKNVRYIFPLHFADNKFGGCAVVSEGDLMNLSNRYLTGNPYEVETATDQFINYRLSNGLDGLANVGIFGLLKGVGTIPLPSVPGFPGFDIFKCPVNRVGCLDEYKLVESLLVPDPRYTQYPGGMGANGGPGHINKKGLTTLGENALKEMMKLGMLIDIDHMSQKSADRSLQIASDFKYPLNTGHNGFREEGEKVSENSRSISQVSSMTSLGGMFGVGFSDNISAGYLHSFRKGFHEKNFKKGLCLGSDINGLVTMPRPRFYSPRSDALRDDYKNFDQTIRANAANMVRYEGSTKGINNPLTLCRMGDRVWNYNYDGVAHIGLYPDFLQDLKNLGMTAEERTAFFSSAEYFAQMWERCEQQKTKVR